MMSHEGTTRMLRYLTGPHTPNKTKIEFLQSFGRGLPLRAETHSKLCMLLSKISYQFIFTATLWIYANMMKTET